MVIREMSEEHINSCVNLSHRVRRESWKKYEKDN